MINEYLYFAGFMIINSILLVAFYERYIIRVKKTKKEDSKKNKDVSFIINGLTIERNKLLIENKRLKRILEEYREN